MINESLSVNRKADAGFYNKTHISNKIKKQCENLEIQQKLFVHFRFNE